VLQPNIGGLRAVADCLDQTGLKYAFVGGAIVNLLLDGPERSPARPTDDCDVIIEVVASQRYSDLEARLRDLGFDHDMSPDAPRCRWILDGMRVDIMPTDGEILGFNTAWCAEALAAATEREFAHTKLKLISPIGFLATKYVAFCDRGNNDHYASPDLEDFVTVIDGRAHIVAEIDQAPSELRSYVISAVRNLLTSRDFNEALPGQIPLGEASQRRLPGLRQKLREIAKLG
jgi:hypothetical protein